MLLKMLPKNLPRSSVWTLSDVTSKNLLRSREGFSLPRYGVNVLVFIPGTPRPTIYKWLAINWMMKPIFT